MAGGVVSAREIAVQPWVSFKRFFRIVQSSLINIVDFISYSVMASVNEKQRKTS